jgi:hypothetical protein
MNAHGMESTTTMELISFSNESVQLSFPREKRRAAMINITAGARKNLGFPHLHVLRGRAVFDLLGRITVRPPWGTVNHEEHEGHEEND